MVDDGTLSPARLRQLLMRRADPTRQTRGATPPILGSDGAPVVGSVAALERTTLGETQQWTLLRGHRDTNPVLLVITGGLGGTTIGTFGRTLGELERHFTVVTWDCRGAGKSLRAGYPRRTMTVTQLTSDALELVAGLRTRFHQRKIVLLGHSLGTLVAVRMLQERPEWFRAFVSVAPVVNPASRDRAVWQATIDAATAAGDRWMLWRLRRAGSPPHTSAARILRYRLLALAAARYLGTDLDLGRVRLSAPTGSELTWLDRLRTAIGQLRTFQTIYPRLQHLDLVTQAARLEVPVFLVTGRAPDPVEDLVLRYHDALDAPTKALVRPPAAGPPPPLADPRGFTDWMVATVLPLTQSTGGPSPTVATP